MNRLWGEDIEREFFLDSLNVATPEQLFYLTDTGQYIAYWPKAYGRKKSTLQSRNSLIGNYTEKWVADLLQNTINDRGLYAIHGTICDELGLSYLSPADVIISKSKEINQKADDILIIIEVKMSILIFRTIK